MHSSFLSAGFCTLAALLFCFGSSAATAQVRMFHQIRGIALEEAQPGTEKQYKELSEALAKRTMLIPPGASSWWAGPENLARCALRGDLPKPRRLGLECHDWAGRYVGTLRINDVNELFKRLSECQGCGPGALPLTEYRYIFVEPVRDEPWVRDYVSQILQKDSGWQVVVAPDVVRPEETERLLYCVVEIDYGGDFPILQGTASVHLKNIHGESIRYVNGWADFSAPTTATSRRQSQRRYRRSGRHTRAMSGPLFSAPHLPIIPFGERGRESRYFGTFAFSSSNQF